MSAAVPPEPTIFVSWSGEQARQAGLVISNWLQEIYQRVDVFYSPESIDKGLRGYVEIQAAISRAVAAIVVVTPESSVAPWVNYEAGALSMQAVDGGGERKVVPFLVGLDSPADVTGPLTLFQMATRRRDEVVKMVASLNKVMGIDPGRAERMVDSAWDQLDSGLEEISFDPAEIPEARTERQILEELLELARASAGKDTARQSVDVAPTRATPEQVADARSELLTVLLGHENVVSAVPERAPTDAWDVPSVRVEFKEGYTDDDVDFAYNAVSSVARACHGALVGPPVIANVDGN